MPGKPLKVHMPVVDDIWNIIFVCRHYNLEFNIPLIQGGLDRYELEHKYFTDELEIYLEDISIVI